eukprot:Clim_evm42s152 gene=Clim_evmTU42s152
MSLLDDISGIAEAELQNETGVLTLRHFVGRREMAISSEHVDEELVNRALNNLSNGLKQAELDPEVEADIWTAVRIIIRTRKALACLEGLVPFMVSRVLDNRKQYKEVSLSATKGLYNLVQVSQAVAKGRAHQEFLESAMDTITIEDPAQVSERDHLLVKILFVLTVQGPLVAKEAINGGYFAFWKGTASATLVDAEPGRFGYVVDDYLKLAYNVFSFVKTNDSSMQMEEDAAVPLRRFVLETEDRKYNTTLNTVNISVAVLLALKEISTWVLDDAERKNLVELCDRVCRYGASDDCSYVLTVMSQWMVVDEALRIMIAGKVFEPLHAGGNAFRPEDGDGFGAILVRYLKDPDSSLVAASGRFLSEMHKRNYARLVNHIGMGNAAGFLTQTGMFGGDLPGDEGEDLGDGYVWRDVDVITGTTAIDSEENPFADMTEEEQEREAEKLAMQLQRLNELGIIKVNLETDSEPAPPSGR